VINRVVRVMVGASVLLLAACKSDKPVGPVGPPSQVIEVSPVSRTALANTVVGTPITVAVTDAAGLGVAGQVVTFSVVAGGGSLSGNLSDTTDANGHATAPSWRLGKSANGSGGQKLRAESGTTTPVEISATVTSSYNIVVRFFGTTMTAAQQALFTTAAQRIMGVVVGDMANVPFATDISSCLGQTPGTTTVDETVDDIVIYAQAKAIDGPNKVLGSAGPCYIRQGSGCAIGCDKIPILGVMTFDTADLNSAGLQDVITHEMLHVLGLGSLWRASYFNFITGAGTLDPRYTAAEARASCAAVGGGTVPCASTVPAEGCADHPECQPTAQDSTIGAGTRDSHWREQNFGAELMTGFLNNGANPFSSVTIGGLKDLGYSVNASDNDTYTIFLGSGSAVMAMPAPAPFSKDWEGRHTAPLYGVDLAGAISLLRKGP
jgi:hypothetical protein